MSGALLRQAGAEFVGTGLLVAVVLLASAAAARWASEPLPRAAITGGLIALGLGAIILAFHPISGAHLNPVVTLGIALGPAAWEPLRIAIVIAAQLLGGALGAVLGAQLGSLVTAPAVPALPAINVGKELQ